MKLDRLLGILTVLLKNDRVTAPELAEKFEVNKRTIGRDIDTLCQAGIPIVTHQGIGGGISIDEKFKLEKSILNAEELANIIMSLKSVREPVIIDLASYYKEQLTEKIEFIKQAILKTRLIEFDYYYESGESHRIIEPYFVIFKWSSWYLFGFCLERQDWRMFKLLRLWNLKSHGEKFLLREIPAERREFEANYKDNINLIALFDISERYKLIEAYGLNCYKETSEGLMFEFGFENRRFLLDWLLGFGDKVKVLEPEDVADEVKSIAEKVLLKYKMN